ncbi:MAG: WD40 repeat domain-containing protein [Leptolyngbyaceae cyanobacterium bins.302]|nr:WD40 repeat domain-containing protein [Leptolyngbyaceae cyanobacterium bins.302]
MGQKRFSQIVGASIALSLLVGLVWKVHSSIKAAIAKQSNDTLCFALSPEKSHCYGAEKILSTQPTTAIATDGKGELLVSSNRVAIDVWNLTTGQRLRSLNGHTQWVSTLAISPNGRTLASGSLDGTINLWDLETGELQATLFADQVTVLAFSPDGTTLASGSRLVKVAHTKVFHPIVLWDMATGRQLTTIAVKEPVTAIAFSPDGQRLAFGSTQANVWDLPTQRLSYTVNSGDLNALIFSADGRLLLTGSDGVRGEDGIKFWDADTGKLVRVLDSVAADFALSPDGERLITTYGGTANLWRISPFGYLGVLRGSTYSGLVARFGLNGEAIATGSSDGVKVWLPTSAQRTLR